MRAPIEKRNTYELIAEQLLSEIGTRLRPGDPLPTERELTATFKVGRSSVREGLRMLESKGVIEAVGNGSFVVSELREPAQPLVRAAPVTRRGQPERALRAAADARGRGRGAAAARRSDEDIAAMALAIEDMARGLGDRDTYAAADVRFHVAVAAATGNRMALHAMHAIRELLERALEQVYGIPGSAARSLEQHREILAAIEAGGAGTPACACDPTSLASSARSTRRSRRAGWPISARRLHQRTRWSSAMAQIGYVGLGVMGGGVARRLLEAGHDVTGHNRTRSKADALIADGMAFAETPREAAERSDVVFSMVTNTAALEAVSDGPDGFLAGLGAGQGLHRHEHGQPGSEPDLAERVAGRAPTCSTRRSRAA